VTFSPICQSPRLSADGRILAFAIQANVAPGATGDGLKAYARDLVAGRTELVSDAAFGPTLSLDGRTVAFSGVDGDGEPRHVFVHDRVTGTTSLVSRTSGVSGTPADGESSSSRD
jgi:hypothetical protein